MYEQLRIQDGEDKMAKKLLTEASFANAYEPRPSSEAIPGKVGFGCAVPRHQKVVERDFQTTSRHDFTGTTPDAAYPDGFKTAGMLWYG